MPIVSQIAVLTPNRTDDEIIKVYETYHIADLFDASKDKTVLLRDAAGIVIKEQLGNGVSANLINMAIEIALATIKKRK